MQVPADQFTSRFDTQFSTQSISFPKARWVSSVVTGVLVFAMIAAFIFFSVDETRALFG